MSEFPPPSSSVQRRLSASTLAKAARYRANDYLVFLAGPYINPDDASVAAKSPAATLRHELFHKLQGHSYEVSLGEYKELNEANKEVLRRHNNAAAAEITHARHDAQVIIIIVDSPGSFAEIGAFSMAREICQKMLVISDVLHKDSTGYVNTGPVAAARSFGAQIAYVDVNDISSVEEIVTSFIADKISENIMEDMMRGKG